VIRVPKELMRYLPEARRDALHSAGPAA
jgi:hypothetical protein